MSIINLQEISPNLWKALYQGNYDKYTIKIKIDGQKRIDALDQWLDKAQEYVDQNNPNEAILICKACIEEYASWYNEQDFEREYFGASYQDRSFDILSQVLSMP